MTLYQPVGGSPVWPSTVSVAPWAALPKMVAVEFGWARTLRPMGLNTVRMPLVWIGTLGTEPEPPVVAVVALVVVVVGATVAGWLDPLQPATRNMTATATTIDAARRGRGVV